MKQFVSHYGYNFPVFNLEEEIDQQIRKFCIMMVLGGAWCAMPSVLSLAMSHFQKGDDLIIPQDESDSYALYQGCTDYIWSVMPQVYRQHIIDVTGYEHFHIVGHNYFPFDYPKDWWNDHAEKATYLVKGELLDVFGQEDEASPNS